MDKERRGASMFGYSNGSIVLRDEVRERLQWHGQDHVGIYRKREAFSINSELMWEAIFLWKIGDISDILKGTCWPLGGNKCRGYCKYLGEGQVA